ncbi:MAG: hypothetical protein [Podoviridae sp. ctg2L5]|nr:MAG: hypothetical protein [Podoviridae sp. ctg2L5]
MDNQDKNLEENAVVTDQGKIDLPEVVQPQTPEEAKTDVWGTPVSENQTPQPESTSEPIEYEQPFLARTVATGDKVFLVFKDERRWVTSPEALALLGYQFGDEHEVKYNQLLKYPEGEAIGMDDAKPLREELGNKRLSTPNDSKSEPEDETETSFAEINHNGEPVIKDTDEPTTMVNVDVFEPNYFYEVHGEKPEAVFIVPIIRSDYIKRYLDTLYKYTPIDFRVIVIDQTVDKKAYNECKDQVHLWINSYRNLGFSKAHNTGALLALREEPKYIVFSNDDIEFMNKRWWGGIMETFALDPKIVGVNPNSPRIAMWGYGVNGYLDIIDHKPEFSEEDYNFCLTGDFESVKATKKAKTTAGEEVDIPASFPGKQSGVIDAVATWCTVFKTEELLKLGLWDERYFPGSGEDYDMMARAYSSGYPERREKYDPDQHLRVVGTTKSWAWHHWTKSKDFFNQNPEAQEKMNVRPNFSDAGAPWRELSEGEFDVWGSREKDGVKIPLIREKKIVVDSL